MARKNDKKNNTRDEYDKEKKCKKHYKSTPLIIMVIIIARILYKLVYKHKCGVFERFGDILSPEFIKQFKKRKNTKKDAVFQIQINTQPVKIDLNKKSLPMQKTFQTFKVDAKGFRKTMI